MAYATRPRENLYYLLNLSSALVNQPADDFTTTLPQTLNTSVGQWHLQLVSLGVWNTMFNISDQYGNRTFTWSVDGGVTTNTGTITPGIYAAEDLIAAIQEILLNHDYGVGGDDFGRYAVANIRLEINVPTLGFRLSLGGVTTLPGSPTPVAPAGPYELDLSAGATSNLHINFGADAINYDTQAPDQLFPNQADISNGITSYVINCDLASSSTTAGLPGQAIYTFVPNDVPPGAVYSVQPSYPIPVEINTPAINSVRIRITDQLGRPVRLQENTTFQNNSTTLSLLLTRADPMKA
jgi:hypothetical protein